MLKLPIASPNLILTLLLEAGSLNHQELLKSIALDPSSFLHNLDKFNSEKDILHFPFLSLDVESVKCMSQVDSHPLVGRSG